MCSRVNGERGTAAVRAFGELCLSADGARCSSEIPDGRGGLLAAPAKAGEAGAGRSGVIFRVLPLWQRRTMSQ
jgi:hypothetical protein